jgi:cytosine/uracil/thiamine/allantoin permease
MAKLRHGWKLFRDFTRFARQNKIYWIIPLMLVLGLIALVVVAGQSAAPHLYTLF